MGHSFLCIDKPDYNRHQYLAAVTSIIHIDELAEIIRWLGENDYDYKAIQGTFYFQTNEERFRFILVWS